MNERLARRMRHSHKCDTRMVDRSLMVAILRLSSRVGLIVVVGIAFMIGVLRTSSAQEDSATDRSEKPNIVFVFIDDLGFGDFSCFGNPHIRTPNIDRLASDGCRFEQFYVASPICSPSRVGVTTGQYPARHGIHSYLASRRQNQRRGMRDYLSSDVQTIAKSLQSVGYSTAHFGKWHMGGGRDVDDAPLPAAYGFDESVVSFEGLGDRLLPPGGLSRQSRALGQGTIEDVEKHELTQRYVDRSIDFMQRQVESDRPFYLQLWLNDVHDGHRPSEDQLVALQVEYGIGTGEKPSWASNPFNLQFYAVLREMDIQLGRLFDSIDEMGIADNTLIILTGDNGPTAWPSYENNGSDAPGLTGGLRGRKWSLYEGGIRQPLIVKWPGRVPEGSVDRTSILSALDLLPTMCAIASVDTAGMEFDGQDVAPVWLGTPFDRSEAIFFEYGRDPSYLQPFRAIDQSPNLAVRRGNWKLLVDADMTRIELYRMDRNRAEFRNVVGEHPEIANELLAALFEWKATLPGYESEFSGTNLPVHNVVAARQGHSIASSAFPDVSNSEITIDARLTTEGRDGVVIAHGGERNGYTLFIQNGRPHFTVRTDAVPTTVVGNDALPIDRIVRLRARLNEDQQISLEVDGESVAPPAQARFLTSQPVDPFDVGRDGAGRVGEYSSEFEFGGSMHRLLVTLKPNDQVTNPSRMVTRFAGEVDFDRPHAVYPRPALRRGRWINLNGFWNVAKRTMDSEPPETWGRRVVVPFAVESMLSGVQQTIIEGEAVWLRREFEIPRGWSGRSIVLHLGRVGGIADVYLNDIAIGEGIQGRLETSLDITDQVETGNNILVVRIQQPDALNHFHQDAVERFALHQKEGVVTGLVDTVWIESIPRAHIGALSLAADATRESVLATVEFVGIDKQAELICQVEFGGEIVARQARIIAGGQDAGGSANFDLTVGNPNLWSPDDSHLYDVVFELRIGERVVDRVESYVAFRDFQIVEDEDGGRSFELNGSPLFVVVADYTSWWPETLAVAPTDSALQYDLRTAKSLGINTIRVAGAVPSDRFYYWADRLGLLVWQSIDGRIVEPGTLDEDFAVEDRELRATRRPTAESRTIEAFSQLSRHPSIVAWESRSDDEAANRLCHRLAAHEWFGRGRVSLGPESMTIDHSFQVAEEDDAAPRASMDELILADVSIPILEVPGHSRRPLVFDPDRPDLGRVEYSVEYLDALMMREGNSILSGVHVGALLDGESIHHGLVTLDRAFVKVNERAFRNRLARWSEQDRAAEE